MTTFTLFTATTSGLASNTHYPNKATITDAADLEAAARFDHVAAEYQGNQRSTHGFVTSDCLIMDIDNDHSEIPDEWVTPQGLADLLASVEFMTVTSRNHNTSKHGTPPRPRFHVYLPISPVTDPAAYAGLKKSLADRFDFFDAGALDAARFLYGHPAPQVEAFTGSTLVDEWLTRQAEADAFAAFDAATLAIGEGSRNATLSRFAGRVLIRYGDTDQARTLFDRKAALCDPPLPTPELEAIWRSALRVGKKVAENPDYISPDAYAMLTGLCPDDFTDLGQATIMAINYLDRVRYSPATKYLAYDGGVWLENEQVAHRFFQDLTERQLTQARDNLTKARTVAADTGALQLLASASKAKALAAMTPAQRDAFERVERAEAWLAFVYKCRSSRSIQAAMKETQPLVLIDPGDLDQDPYLLCTPGGTLDLREGASSLRPNQPGDLITRQTSLAPSSEGMDVWLAALEVIFQGNRELIGYVQRICGLAAIGKVMVEALIIAYGDGANGKSTFWNTIARVLDSYASSINAEVLIAGKKNSAKNDMAETRGRRLLIAAETEEGKRLSTASAKQLASTDKIAAEKKFKDPFSFTPSHSLVLYTNHLPKVGAMDHGIWRRLIVVPFEAKIEGNRDVKNYGDVLFEQAGGAVLAWIIEGARLIHDENYQLTPPSCVVEATEAYRESNNWFAHFLEECCTTGQGLMTPSGEFYQTYRAWALASGEYVRSTRDFYAALEREGMRAQKVSGKRMVIGVELNDEHQGL